MMPDIIFSGGKGYIGRWDMVWPCSVERTNKHLFVKFRRKLLDYFLLIPELVTISIEELLSTCVFDMTRRDRSERQKLYTIFVALEEMR